MPFPLNPADKQRYKNYTYDGASRSWKQDFIYQEQLDFGNEDGKLNSSDIPVYNSPGETVHEYIIDSVSLTKEQTIAGAKTFTDDILVSTKLTNANPTNTAADFLKLSLIGGEFGVEPKEVNLTLYNKNGVTGAVFENNNLDVIDFGFKTLNEMQGNIRFENRTAYLDNGILNSPNGEFQFFDNPLLLETSADPEDWTYKTTFAIGRKKATLNTELSVVDDVTVESGVVNLTSSATVSFNATSKTIDFIFN